MIRPHITFPYTFHSLLYVKTQLRWGLDRTLRNHSCLHNMGGVLCLNRLIIKYSTNVFNLKFLSSALHGMSPRSGESVGRDGGNCI